MTLTAWMKVLQQHQEETLWRFQGTPQRQRTLEQRKGLSSRQQPVELLHLHLQLYIAYIGHMISPPYLQVVMRMYVSARYGLPITKSESSQQN